MKKNGSPNTSEAAGKKTARSLQIASEASSNKRCNSICLALASRFRLLAIATTLSNKLSALYEASTQPRRRRQLIYVAVVTMVVAYWRPIAVAAAEMYEKRDII